ncbi:NUDIX domain-containing protein [Thioalkalivibrio sp. XN8]|nr:NUDIX domain-containing protein [Thioalkalivibrio sp. XN8]
MACAALPLVSIDLFLVSPGEAGPELLLGWRNNRPAQGWWFTPGGRIRKNEPIGQAMERVAIEEVGLAPEILREARLLGAWDHFYPDSAFDPSVSTHYVNLAYLVQVSRDVAGSLALASGQAAQHSAWRWFSLQKVLDEPAVHENVRGVVRRILASSGT